MKKRVTLKQIANSVGVHVSTVSRALNADTRDLINQEMVEKIVQVSKDLNYRQNAAAYSLKTNRTRTIGVIIPDITNQIFPPIIRGIEDALLPSGFIAIVGNTDGDRRRENELIDMFMSRGIDGLVVASVEQEDQEIYNLVKEGIPVVTANRRVKNDAVNSIIHDDSDGIKRVLTHLVSQGHRKIAHIAGPQLSSTGSLRCEAFKSHSKILALDTDDSYISYADAYNEQAGERCMEELLVRSIEMTAIVCANDRLAIGTLAALARRNLKCPQDISVTGFNNMPFMDRISPTLTTIRILQYEMGKKAGQILLNAMETEQPPEHVILPVELVIRGSTGPCK